MCEMDHNRLQVNSWILDFTFSIVWNDFIETGSIDNNSNRDLIQWILSQPFFASEETEKKFQLLLILCRLADGREYMTKYEEDGDDLTVLEDALARITNFLETLSEELKTKAQKLIDSVKEEAVLVCCRDNNFEVAEEVFKRLYKSDNERQKNFSQKIEDVLKSKSPGHAYLKSTEFEKVLVEATDYFKLVNKDIKLPFLLQLAKEKQEDDTELLTRENGENSPAWNTSLDKYIDLNTLKKAAKKLEIRPKEPLLNFMEVRSLRDKLRKRKMEDINGNASPGPSSRKVFKTYPTRKGINNNSSDSSSDSTPVNKRLNSASNINDNTKNNMVMRNRQLNLDRSQLSSRNFWTEQEVEEFYKAVQKIGVGKWSAIKIALETNRTNVQLKDKWRNITKTTDIKRLRKKFGNVSQDS